MFRIVFKNIFEDPEDFEKFKDFVIARGPDGYIKNLNVGSISSNKTTNGSNSDNIISLLYLLVHTYHIGHL